MAAQLCSVVLLAGGASSRMGVPKGLVQVDGRPWIEHQLCAAERVASSRAVVVLGFEHARYVREVRNLATRAVVTVNPAPERGPFTSLQCGLAHVAADVPVFVLPVDVPAPGERTWASLYAALGSGVDATLPVHEGHGGHPVLLSPAFVRVLLGLGGRTRLDFELQKRVVVRVPVEDPRVLCNLNRPEDWRELERSGSQTRPRGIEP